MTDLSSTLADGLTGSAVSRKRAKSFACVAGLLAAGSLAAIAQPAHATTLTWDSDGNFGAGTLGGTGTWDTSTTANWSGAASPDVQWTDTTGVDTAVFSGTAGIVTITAVTANKLQFSTNAYTLSGGSLTLAQDTSAGAPAPLIAYGATTGQIITSSITANNLSITGTGSASLSLNGNNVGITGTTTISESLTNGAIGVTTTGVVNGGTNNGFGSSTLKFINNAQVNYRNNGDGSTNAQILNYGNNIELSGGNLALNVGRTAGSASDRKTFSFGTLIFDNANVLTFAGAIGSSPSDRISFNNVSLGANGNVAFTAVSGVASIGAISETVAGRSFTVSTGTGVAGTILVVTGASTYTGATNVQVGTLQDGVDNALPTGTTLTLGNAGAAATLDLNGHSQTVGGLAANSGATAASVTNNSATANATITFTGTGTSTFAGVIKEGTTHKTALAVTAGTLVLSGANTYTGGTVVSGGTLATASTGGTFGNGSVSVTGGVLELDNANSINDAAALALGNGTKIFLNFAAGNENVGGLTIDGTSFANGTVFSSNQLNGVDSSYFQFQDNSGNATLTVVPEPASLGLFALTGLGVLKRRRRRGVSVASY